MNLDLRFLQPKATCALCGREVDPEQAVTLFSDDVHTVAVSEYDGHVLADVTPGELIVVCRSCLT